MLERLTGLKDKVINWISCGSFGLSLICICIGLDKLFRYKNGDVYPYELQNAYVGGDAYNYIINGNYATACFVLATMFVIIGFGVLVFAYLKQAYCERTTKSEPIETETSNFKVEEL